MKSRKFISDIYLKIGDIFLPQISPAEYAVHSAPFTMGSTFSGNASRTWIASITLARTHPFPLYFVCDS